MTLLSHIPRMSYHCRIETVHVAYSTLIMTTSRSQISTKMQRQQCHLSEAKRKYFQTGGVVLAASPDFGPALSTPAIFSVAPAIRLSGPLKSGKLISASSRPAIHKMCICVNIARRPNTQTISNWILLCAKRSGSACNRKYTRPIISTKSTRNTAMTTMSASISPGAVTNHGRWPEKDGCMGSVMY